MLTAPMGFTPSEPCFLQGIVTSLPRWTHLLFLWHLMRWANSPTRQYQPQLLGFDPCGNRWPKASRLPWSSPF